MNLRFLTVVSLLALICSVGCSGGSSPDAAVGAANKTNMQRLANLYVLHQVKNKFQGPADETAFKAFISSAGEDTLSKMGTQSSEIESLFVCERDDQPFKIKYGVLSGPRGSQEPVIFESTGSGGKKMVGFLNMVQREVDDAEYEQLWGAKIAAPVAGGDRNMGGTR